MLLKHIKTGSIIDPQDINRMATVRQLHAPGEDNIGTTVIFAPILGVIALNTTTVTASYGVDNNTAVFCTPGIPGTGRANIREG